MRRPDASFAALAASGLSASNEAYWRSPLARVLMWGLAAGVLDSLAVFARLRPAPQSWLLDGVTLLLFPAFAVLLTLITAALFHGACQMLGGKAPWPASLRAMASLAWTAPLDVAALLAAPLALVLAAYRLFLLSRAAIVLHGLSLPRSIAAALLLGLASFILLATAATGLSIFSASI